MKYLIVFLSFLFLLACTKKEVLDDSPLGKARQAFAEQDFYAAADGFRAVFEQEDETVEDMVFASLSALQLNDIDSALIELQHAAEAGLVYPNMQAFEQDPRFYLLHGELAWDSIRSIVSKNIQSDIASASMPDLRAELDLFAGRRNQIQIQLDTLIEIPDSLYSAFAEMDSIQQLFVMDILDSLGWLGHSLVGKGGSRTSFDILKNAGANCLKPYEAILAKANENQEISPALYAEWSDKIAVIKGEKQAYGTQYHSGGRKMYPFKDDIKMMNQRRMALGLYPINAKFAPEVEKSEEWQSAKSFCD